MINILIVDDEEYSVNYIKSALLSSNLEITNLYTATNGLAALNIVYSNPINIVITDIKMPHMDGIALATKIRESRPLCKFIFMSAYSEKEYYKSAIRLKVDDFIEKPIDVAELKEQLAVMIDDIKADTSIQNLRFDDVLLVVREALSSDLTKSFLDYDEINRKLLMCDLAHIYDMHCITGIIKFVKPAETDEDVFFGNIAALYKNFPENPRVVILKHLKGNNVLVFHAFSEDKANLTFDNLKYIYNYFLNNAYLYSTISSLGDTACGIQNTFQSYQSATIHLEAGFIYGYNETVYSIPSKDEYCFDTNDIDKIKSAIVNNDKSAVSEIVDGICSKLLLFPYTPSYKIKNYFTELYSSILNLSNQALPAHSFNDANTLEDVKIEIGNLANRIFDNPDTLKPSEPVVKAMAYINAHFLEKDISLKDISKEVALSTSYLCVLFKKETGKTINNYLTECRINKAKELLRDTEATVDSIANLLGFSDIKYFYRLFKRFSGLTPDKYRRISDRSTAE